MNPSLSPNSRMPVRALADRHVARDETRWMTFGCCRSMLRRAATNPTRKGGGRAFGVKHPAYLDEGGSGCAANKKHKEGYNPIQPSDTTKKKVEDMQLHPHPCQIHNVIAATVLKVVSTVGNSTIRYHESLTLGDIFKSCF